MMSANKRIITGMIAMGAVLTAQPALAVEQPPLFQYQDGELQVTQLGQYDSGQGEGGTEIIAYDAKLQRAYVTNGASAGFDILPLAHLQSGEFKKIESEKRVLLSQFNIENIEDITSIAVHPTKDLIAISAVSNPKTDPGYIVFATKDGEYIHHVRVGALPDMVTFTPDGTKALVANEGEPNDDYTVDPEGSISIIDLTTNEFAVKHLTFEGVDLDENVRVSSKGTVQQQLEPEFIAVADDSKTAYVALQENNAIATIDLVNLEITAVKGLGMKDHSAPGNELDTIDDGKINIEKQPLLGFYMPDAIDTYTVADKTYILTPNEGDARDYDAYSEEAKITDIADKIRLNADHYEGYTQEELDQLAADGLFEKDRLGDTKITLENGKNEDSIYESLHTYGARSFSIFDADTMELVYDSSSDFERIIAEAMPEHFNTNNDELEFDGRSNAKGPEPETVVVGEIDSKPYAFIALERFSGIMVYDISNPKSPKFTTLISSRDFSEDVKGDVSPEGLQFIPASDSPTGTPLLTAAHEVSGTVAVYEIKTKEPASSALFTDIEGHWAQNEIEELAKRGIVKGTKDNEFKPNHEITRAEFTAFLVRSFDLETAEETNNLSFSDLETGKWYEDEVNEALRKGIAKGFDDGTFRPYAIISREEMAAMITRVYERIHGEHTLETEVLTPFKDRNDIGNWAMAAFAKAVDLGIIHGVTSEELQPKKSATRAEAITMVKRLLDK